MRQTLGGSEAKVPCGLHDEERLTKDSIALMKVFGRYGCRMITNTLDNSGWPEIQKRPFRQIGSANRLSSHRGAAQPGVVHVARRPDPDREQVPSL